MHIWRAVEDTPAGKKILLAFKLALRGTAIMDIERETGLPHQSLHDIRKNGAFSHRKASAEAVAT